MIKMLLQRLLRLVFHNFGYKLLSILLAVIVWAIIQGEQVQEVSTEVHVNIHVASGFGIRGETQRVKAATLRGPQAWLLEVPKKLVADVYLSAGRVGRYRIRLSKDDVKNLNERLELVIHEPYLDLFLDRLIERSAPVKESIHGTPPDGYYIKQVTIEPDTVTVKGIRTDLLKLRYVFTEAIDVSDLKEDRSLQVKLASPGLGADALGVDTVQVNIQIGDSKINRRFGGIPIAVLGGDGPGSVRPETVSLLVQGLPRVLNELKASDFSASIDVRGLSPGRHETSIQVKIPAETTLIETIPEKGLVSIEKAR